MILECECAQDTVWPLIVLFITCYEMHYSTVSWGCVYESKGDWYLSLYKVYNK